MKKLITGAVAAFALLFGFASCSGDLHDSVVSKLYAEGDFCTEKVGNDNVRLPFVMTKGSDTEQKCEFKYDASKMTAWGGGGGTLNFKITRDFSGWAKDWGGKKDIAVELSVNSQEWLDLEGRDAVNSNPGNIVLKDLADGNSYTLIAKYDASSEKLSLKCVGAVTDYPILKAVITDDSKGSELTAALATLAKDGLSKEVILTRTGKFYESDLFVPTKNGSVSYYLTNGYLYWGADGEMSTSKPTNEIEGEWTYDENQPTLARKIFVSAADFTEPISDKNPNPKNKLVSKIQVHDTGILGKADIIGAFDDWKGSSLTYVDATTQIFEFENAKPSIEFVIREVTGSWGVGRWFKGIPADTADRKKTDMANDIVAAKYGEDATAVPLIYYSGDAGNDGKNAVITGLPYKTGYKFRVTVKILDASSKKISVSCAAMEEIPAEAYEAPKAYSFKGAVLKGGWEGWWADAKPMTADKTQEFTTIVGEHPASGNEFGIFNPDNNWAVSNLELGKRTEMKYSAEKVENCTMKENWEVGATYKIKIELTDNSGVSPKAYITISKN